MRKGPLENKRAWGRKQGPGNVTTEALKTQEKAWFGKNVLIMSIAVKRVRPM